MASEPERRDGSSHSPPRRGTSVSAAAEAAAQGDTALVDKVLQSLAEEDPAARATVLAAALCAAAEAGKAAMVKHLCDLQRDTARPEVGGDGSGSIAGLHDAMQAAAQNGFTAVVTLLAEAARTREAVVAAGVDVAEAAPPGYIYRFRHVHQEGGTEWCSKDYLLRRTTWRDRMQHYPLALVSSGRLRPLVCAAGYTAPYFDVVGSDPMRPLSLTNTLAVHAPAPDLARQRRLVYCDGCSLNVFVRQLTHPDGTARSRQAYMAASKLMGATAVDFCSDCCTTIVVPPASDQYENTRTFGFPWRREQGFALLRVRTVDKLHTAHRTGAIPGWDLGCSVYCHVTVRAAPGKPPETARLRISAARPPPPSAPRAAGHEEAPDVHTLTPEFEWSYTVEEAVWKLRTASGEDHPGVAYDPLVYFQERVTKLKTSGARTQRDFFQAARIASIHRHARVSEATSAGRDAASRTLAAEEVPMPLKEAPDFACGTARRLRCGSELLSHEQIRGGGDQRRSVIEVPLADIVAVEPLLARHKAGEEALGALPQRWVSIVFARAGQFYQIYLRMLDEGVAETLDRTVYTAPADVRQCATCHLVLPPEMHDDAVTAHTRACAARHGTKDGTEAGSVGAPTAPTTSPQPAPAARASNAHPGYAPLASSGGGTGGPSVVTSPYPGIAFRTVRTRGRTMHDTLLTYLFALPWASKRPKTAATCAWNPLRALLWAQAQTVDMPWTTSGYGMADLGGQSHASLESRNLQQLDQTLDNGTKGLLAQLNTRRMHLHSVRSSVADGSVVEVMVEGELARGVVRSVTDAGRVTVRLRTGTDVVVDEGGLRRVDATEQAIDKRVDAVRRKIADIRAEQAALTRQLQQMLVDWRAAHNPEAKQARPTGQLGKPPSQPDTGAGVAPRAAASAAVPVHGSGAAPQQMLVMRRAAHNPEAKQARPTGQLGKPPSQPDTGAGVAPRATASAAVPVHGGGAAPLAVDHVAVHVAPASANEGADRAKARSTRMAHQALCSCLCAVSFVNVVLFLLVFQFSRTGAGADAA